MIQELQIRILPEQAASEQGIKKFLVNDKGLDEQHIHHVRILKRSIDARQRTIYVNLTVRVYLDEEPTDQAFTPIAYHDVSERPAAIVVGAGPGGLFAALRLIELGIRPSYSNEVKMYTSDVRTSPRYRVSIWSSLNRTSLLEKVVQELSLMGNSTHEAKNAVVWSAF